MRSSAKTQITSTTPVGDKGAHPMMTANQFQWSAILVTVTIWAALILIGGM